MNIEDKRTHAVGIPRPAKDAVPGRPPRLGLRHVAGRERYLFRVDLYLDGKIPGRQRKRILADLRNSIDADAGNNSLKDVLAGLGQPKELAASYLEGADQSRPLWSAGFMAALGMLSVYWLFMFTYTIGMLAVTMQTGGDFQSHFFFVEVSAFSGNDGVGIGWSGAAALWFPLALAALAFIPASRAWRAIGRRQG